MRHFILSAIIFGGLLAGGSVSLAQQSVQSARQSCCTEIGGTYRNASASRANSTYCFGLSRGTVDAYYKCVERKSGGKAK
ncbi:MAG: hypothetical protein EPO23_13485 [Xanthobacteraceae bacterium]|nr:MAG: hypothetical protein EPO23_13485 [Xanthobacteraceae bacterium]